MSDPIDSEYSDTATRQAWQNDSTTAEPLEDSGTDETTSITSLPSFDTEAGLSPTAANNKLGDDSHSDAQFGPQAAPQIQTGDMTLMTGADPGALSDTERYLEGLGPGQLQDLATNVTTAHPRVSQAAATPAAGPETVRPFGQTVTRSFESSPADQARAAFGAPIDPFMPATMGGDQGFGAAANEPGGSAGGGDQTQGQQGGGLPGAINLWEAVTIPGHLAARLTYADDTLLEAIRSAGEVAEGQAKLVAQTVTLSGDMVLAGGDSPVGARETPAMFLAQGSEYNTPAQFSCGPWFFPAVAAWADEHPPPPAKEDQQQGPQSAAAPDDSGDTALPGAQPPDDRTQTLYHYMT